MRCEAQHLSGSPLLSCRWLEAGAEGAKIDIPLSICQDIARLKTLCSVSGRFWQGGRLQETGWLA
jgi:hypothetical protein